MKSIVLIAAGVTALISGCASIPDQTYSANDNVDVQKVAAINNVAKSRGIQVLWYSYPQRKRAPADVVPSHGEPSGT